jgi:hypothetical protein
MPSAFFSRLVVPLFKLMDSDYLFIYFMKAKLTIGARNAKTPTTSLVTVV